MMEYFYVRATEMHFRNTHLFCSENGENEHVEQKKCKHNFCIPIVRNFPLQLTIRLSIETFSDARFSSLSLSLSLRIFIYISVVKITIRHKITMESTVYDCKMFVLWLNIKTATVTFTLRVFVRRKQHVDASKEERAKAFYSSRSSIYGQRGKKRVMDIIAL